MSPEEMQKFSKDQMDTAMNCFGGWNKSAQAIAVEVADYSKKSLEGMAATWEKVLSSKSPEKAIELQSDYMKSSYEGFIAEANKLGEMYVDFAKEAYKPFESVLAKASAMK
jgi:phasin family protein